MNYLKFSTRQQALAEVVKAYSNGDDGYIEQTRQHFIYEAPPIPKTEGEYDPETNEVITEPTFVEGSHWNLLSDTVPDNLKPFLVYPETPSNKILGIDS